MKLTVERINEMNQIICDFEQEILKVKSVEKKAVDYLEELIGNADYLKVAGNELYERIVSD